MYVSVGRSDRWTVKGQLLFMDIQGSKAEGRVSLHMDVGRLQLAVLMNG